MIMVLTVKRGVFRLLVDIQKALYEHNAKSPIRIALTPRNP